MEEKNENKQMNSIIYVLPCMKLSKDSTYKIDKYELKEAKDTIRLRNLIRGDVINFINNKMKIYSIEFKKNSKNAIYNAFVDSEKEYEFNLKLLRLYFIEFNEENAFLIFNCTTAFGKDPKVNTEDIIKNHKSFMSRYFYYDKGGQSYVHIKLNENDYPLFSNDENSIAKALNIKFDFNNFNARFLMISTFLDASIDMNYENNAIYSFIDSCVYLNQGSFLEKEYKSYRTESFIAKSSNYGSVIAYKAAYDDIESEEFIKVNNKNMQGFYGELFYEYIIALNYKIRLEKFLIKLGTLKYDSEKSNKEYLKAQDELLNYKRFSSESYFVNVSGMDSSNSWYHNVWDGLDIDILDEEVETKFQYSMEYIKIKLDKIEKKQNAFINFLTSYASFIASLALAVLAVIQAASCLTTNIEGTKNALNKTLIIVAIIFGLRVIFDIVKFFKNKRFGH